jgi:endo-1,4-beta-D-glucanase Y
MPHDHAHPDPPPASARWTARVAVVLAALAAAACGGGQGVIATATAPRSTSSVVSTPTGQVESVLQEAWGGYKQTFVQPDGRVIDPTRGGITTSEGQSYALLRAVWMGDRSSFDSVWRWTATHLQVRGDGLFSSLWGGGSVQDHNSASDADSDIALALLYAGRRFGDQGYIAAARTVLGGMWRSDVVAVDGMNVLTAGNWAAAQQSPGPVINPSYFAPYAYRSFAHEDPAHPWMSLVDSSYTLLDRCSSATLDGTVSAGLPPNWCAISRSTGQVVSFPQIPGADDFGYDAFRVMWRVAVDALWNNEPRARSYLLRHDFLRKRWDSAQRLEAVYGHDGTVVAGYEDPTVYGGDVGTFVVADQPVAARIQQRLLAAFQPQSPPHFGDPTNYFEQNWVWFGLALAGGALADLDGG